MYLISNNYGTDLFFVCFIVPKLLGVAFLLFICNVYCEENRDARCKYDFVKNL